ncbi:MAG: hypothetical protein GY720_06760 [bacterium]|nr:hypothetical protein [bacterium]
MIASLMVVAPAPAFAADFTVSFQLATDTTTETGTHDVVVVLNGAAGTLGEDVTVTVVASGGDATIVDDYSFATADVTFPLGSGDGAVETATLNIVVDGDHETDETIDLSLSVPPPGVDTVTAAAPLTHVVTITDDDPVSVAFSTATSDSVEGGTHAPTVALTVPGGGNLASAVTINITDDLTGDADTPDDYILSTALVTFDAMDPDGTTKPVNLDVVADDFAEDDETVDLSFTVGSGPATGSGTHVVTITNDDFVGVTVTPALVSVTEGDGDGSVYTVELTSKPTASVQIDAAVLGSEAAVDPAFVTFAPGEWDQTKDFTVTAIDDAIVDGQTGDQVDHTTSSLDGDYDDIPVVSTVVTVFDDDEAPVGNADFYNVDEGGTLTTTVANGVLFNDTGEGTLTALLEAGPSQDTGGFSLAADGTFTYINDGTAPTTDTFTYRVVDGAANQSAITTVTITIDNVVPVVTAGADPAPVAENENVDVNATFTDPGLADSHTATIDWGDGTVDDCSTPACAITFNDVTGAGTVTGSHSYADVDVYLVTVTVGDGEDSGSGGFTVTVENANLTVAIETLEDVDEGSEASVSATFLDNDGKGVHTATINWGDGTVDVCSTPACTIVDNGDGTGTVTGTHVYADDQEVSVAVYVADPSGDSGTGGATISVFNVAPIVEVTDTSAVPLPTSSNGGVEGVLLKLRSSIVDPGDEDFTYAWSIRLQSLEVAAGTSHKINFRPTVDGTYFVSLTVLDGDGGSDLDNVLITIDNAAPVITDVVFDGTPPIGVATGLTVHFTDPGTEDPHTTTVAWGEGSPSVKNGASPRGFNHTYTSAGTRSLVVCVADDDNESCESFYANPGTVFRLNSDFDGDGFEDLPIGVPGEDGFGAVNVLYGTASGLAAAGDDIWKQGVNGIRGTGEAGDSFGSALAWGDFNMDGFSDLAVAAPGEDIGGKSNVGIVHVISGSASGLTASGDVFFHQDGPGVLGGNQAGDRFGSALASGDFNGDGFADLAIGVPKEDIEGDTNAGRVAVLFGSPAGLTVDGDESWDQDKPGVVGANQPGDRLGTALASGDFDLDGDWDVVAGMPGKDIADKSNSGAILVLGGSTIGLNAAADQKWHQNSGTMKNSAEADDAFGSVLEVGDFNGDDRPDLAIGVPDEGLSGLRAAGAVAVMRSGSGGLTDVGNTFWHENTSGVLGARKKADRFGYALAAADFDEDGRDDLAIGIPYQEVGGKKNAGDVAVLYGSSGGITAAGDQRWNEDSSGIHGAAAIGDHLGSALRALDHDGDGDFDLAVGIPDQNIDGDGNAGAALVINGTPTNGLSAVGDTYWHQDTPGVLESTGVNDRFGKAL